MWLTIVPTTTAEPSSVATRSKLVIERSLPSVFILASLPSVTRLIKRVAASGPAPPHAVSERARAVAINAIEDFLIYGRRIRRIIACQISVI